MSGTTGGVEVKQSPISGAGRGLFATKAFAPGDVVFATDRPQVAELDVERLLDTCGWCLQRAATDPMEKMASLAMGLPSGSLEVKACAGCKRVVYCSKKCQAKAWKREHKYECEAYKCKEMNEESRNALSSHCRAVIKILGRWKADPDGEMRNISDILRFHPSDDSDGLLQQYKEQNTTLFNELQLLGNGAWVFSGRPKVQNIETRGTCHALIYNIVFNAFSLGSPLDDMKLGFIFDTVLCAANHSCDPNVVIVHKQPQAELRALKSIKAGEELCVAYTRTSDPFTVRQAYLKETYLFDCQCPKCLEGCGPDQFLQSPEKLRGPYLETANSVLARHDEETVKHLMPGDNELAMRRLAGLQEEGFNVAERYAGDPDGEADAVKESIQICIGSGMWRWTRQPVPALCRRLFAIYMGSGQFYKAFRIGMKLHLEILPEIHPQSFHPDRLILAWTISTLLNVMSGPANREIYKLFADSGLELRLIYYGFLFYAYENTPLLFGFDSPFGRVVKNTYDQIMAGTNVERATIEANLVDVWPKLEMLARNVDATAL